MKDIHINGKLLEFQRIINVMPSSVVASLSYQLNRRTLRVVYTSGAVYDYIGVEKDIYEQMKAAESKGTFLNMVIKPKYPFRKVN